MHPFTSATLAITASRLDHSISLFEEYAETCGDGVIDPKGLFARAYGELYRLRGLLENADRLEEMAETIASGEVKHPTLRMMVR